MLLVLVEHPIESCFNGETRDHPVLRSLAIVRRDIDGPAWNREIGLELEISEQNGIQCKTETFA